MRFSAILANNYFFAARLAEYRVETTKLQLGVTEGALTFSLFVASARHSLSPRLISNLRFQISENT
jgi:hypothetical protein